MAAIALGSVAVTSLAGRSDDRRSLTVTLRNASGGAVGSVHMTARSRSGTVDVRARVRRMPPGFHGFHIHAVGRCEAPSFMSAMGHLKQEGQEHRDHAGDLSSLLVKRNGTAALALTSDRFRLRDLRDADGSAVVVHADADNFANVPARYAPSGPDRQTLDTGDSGGRLACGAIAGR